MSFLDKFKRHKDTDTTDGADKAPAKASVEKKLEPAKVELKKIAPQEKIAHKVNREDTGNAYQILVRPLITEKNTDLGAINKYVFAVSLKANKSEVRKAIRSLYGVDPIQINIANVRGKAVRYGRSQGMTKNWKKAIVTLKSGDSIQVYEGV
ncbi:50S ribosomal protein L23 [Candidatus Falkowbacteria bacterium]|nr:50S ribosomal protein L23 [Candidatus Falkowbacteria bacterium]